MGDFKLIRRPCPFCVGNDPEAQARARLGAWLAAESGRTWTAGLGVSMSWVRLEQLDGDGDLERCAGYAERPTLADAILAALEQAQS